MGVRGCGCVAVWRCGVEWVWGLGVGEWAACGPSDVDVARTYGPYGRLIKRRRGPYGRLTNVDVARTVA